VKDPVRKKALEDAYEQAQVPLREAVHSAHAFVFEQMRERLKAAKERSEALLTELANP
jgi:flagellar biosynthesis/type III secretory pathway protein FliH